MLVRWDGYGNNSITTGGPIGNAIKELHMINKETKLPNLKPFVKFGRTAFRDVKLPGKVSKFVTETVFNKGL